MEETCCRRALSEALLLTLSACLPHTVSGSRTQSPLAAHSPRWPAGCDVLQSSLRARLTFELVAAFPFPLLFLVQLASGRSLAAPRQLLPAASNAPGPHTDELVAPPPTSPAGRRPLAGRQWPPDAQEAGIWPRSIDSAQVGRRGWLQICLCRLKSDSKARVRVGKTMGPLGGLGSVGAASWAAVFGRAQPGALPCPLARDQPTWRCSAALPPKRLLRGAGALQTAQRLQTLQIPAGRSLERRVSSGGAGLAAQLARSCPLASGRRNPATSGARHSLPSGRRRSKGQIEI